MQVQVVEVVGRRPLNEHASTGSRPELGLCRHCRQLVPLERMRFSNGHEATFVAHQGCDVSYPAVLTFGETWVSCTLEPQPATALRL